MWIAFSLLGRGIGTRCTISVLLCFGRGIGTRCTTSVLLCFGRGMGARCTISVLLCFGRGMGARCSLVYIIILVTVTYIGNVLCMFLPAGGRKATRCITIPCIYVLCIFLSTEKELH